MPHSVRTSLTEKAQSPLQSLRRRVSSMTRWGERLCALFAWLSAPAFVLWISIQTYQSSCAYVSPCTVRTMPSDFQRAPAFTLAVVGGLLLFGLLVGGLIYAHSRTTARGLLITMWVLVPVFALLVIGAAFTWIGSAAFFWAVALLLGAVVGSIGQMVRSHESGALPGSSGSARDAQGALLPLH